MRSIASHVPQGSGLRASVLRGVLVCLSVQLATWALGYGLARTLPFDRAGYFGNFAHYQVDQRAGGFAPRFFELWSYSDSEWYLSLAAGGYPDVLHDPSCGREVPPRPDWSTEAHCRHKFAFFPLYPLLIASLAVALPLPIAAFVATALVALTAAACLGAAFARCFPGRRDDAPVAVALALLYPFALFFHLYFTEGLFLVLSLLAFLCAWQRWYVAMLGAGALLATTRPLGALIVVPLLATVLAEQSSDVRSGRTRGILCALLVPLGLVPFAVLNYTRTGDWHYFSAASRLWGYENDAVLGNLWRNVAGKAAAFPHMAFHNFHDSQLDYVTMVVFAVTLVVMWCDRRMPRALTLWSTLLWLAPLASKDLMSFGRYMSVSFPVFMYLALVLPRRARTAVLVVFAAGYVAALVGVVTYAWVA
jgi:hypothetical protein